MTKDYITPTKDNPVFISQNMYSGYIIDSEYKDWESKNEQYWVCGETTALTLTDAIEAIHKHIQNCKEYINPDTKFDVYMLDGTCDKYGEPIRTKCYSISMKQAKKFKLI